VITDASSKLARSLFLCWSPILSQVRTRPLTRKSEMLIIAAASLEMTSRVSAKTAADDNS
jgi:hypothetical protein